MVEVIEAEKKIQQTVQEAEHGIGQVGGVDGAGECDRGQEANEQVGTVWNRRL